MRVSLYTGIVRAHIYVCTWWWRLHAMCTFSRILRGMVHAWLHEVSTNQNYYADLQLQHFYRWGPRHLYAVCVCIHCTCSCLYCTVHHCPVVATNSVHPSHVYSVCVWLYCLSQYNTRLLCTHIVVTHAVHVYIHVHMYLHVHVHISTM